LTAIVRTAEALAWQLSARCGGTDLSVFFNIESERDLFGDTENEKPSESTPNVPSSKSAATTR
jgi:hypothetical protein